MTIDPITLEVLRNRFDVIADEMQLTLLKSSYSTIVKEGYDASAALFTPEGETISQATAHPIHLGTMIPAVKRVVELFPPQSLDEGDIVVLNDPYEGGTHLPDLILVMPVRSGGKTVALSCSLAHLQEMGGKTPGSVPTDATEIYQEGLRIPPLKLYERGKIDETLVELLTHNVRIPEIVMGDVRAQVAAASVGRNRFLELVEGWGAGVIQGAVDELLDRSEAMTRKEISSLPDGTYVFEDYLDNDGIELEERIAIRGAVTVRGSDFLVDFSGTSPQVRGPLNSVPSSTLSAVYYVVRAITDPAIPNNAGCYRPISVTLPTGSILNPEPPAAVNSRTATVKRCVDVLMGALVRAAPERFPAASTGQLLVLSLGGIDPRTGRAYVTSELGGGGLGARPCKDGIDVVDTDVNNCMNIPVEALEMDYPIRILKNNLWADSCGAGRYRGGLGYEKVFQALRGQVVVSHRGERFYTAPWGLCGGRPGRKSRSLVRRRSGATEEIPSKRVFTLDEGETLHVFTAGGGGWGDPLERPPEEVRSDVLDRKVSQTTAREEYGVIIDAEDQSVNVAATEELRRELRQRRGPITWLFDRGEPLGRS